VSEVVDNRQLAAVHQIGLPRRRRGVLLVVVVPIRGIAGVVPISLASRFLALRQRRAIGVRRIAPEHQVVHAHWHCERDLVVIAESTLEIRWELVIVAGDVPVEHVEAKLPLPIERHLHDIRVGNIGKRNVDYPPDVVLLHLGDPCRLRIVVAVSRVFGARVGKLLGDHAHLHFHAGRCVVAERDRSGEVRRVENRESVAAQSRVDGGQAVASVDRADELGAV
jgi:hypothetical protein